MAKISELPGILDKLSTQLEKAQTEIVAEIATLKASLEDVDIPPAAEASITKLGTLAQTLDDINPDLPPPTP